MTATTTALVMLNEFPDEEPGEPVEFFYNPADCDHGATMCPGCFHEWAVDHRVALPAYCQDFYKAALATARRGRLRFVLD